MCGCKKSLCKDGIDEHRLSQHCGYFLGVPIIRTIASGSILGSLHVGKLPNHLDEEDQYMMPGLGLTDQHAQSPKPKASRACLLVWRLFVRLRQFFQHCLASNSSSGYDNSH